MLRIYSIFDSAAKVYANPFYQRSPEEAERSFSHIVSDDKSVVNKHPEHFVLFELGAFDDSTGELLPHSAPLSVSRAIDVAAHLRGTMSALSSNEAIHV